jgi:hypothetical protein
VVPVRKPAQVRAAAFHAPAHPTVRKGVYRVRPVATKACPLITNPSAAATTGRIRGAFDLQASPLAEGDRNLWLIYIKRWHEVRGVVAGEGFGM